MIDIDNANLAIQLYLDDEKYNEAVGLISKIQREKASKSYFDWHLKLCKNPQDNEKVLIEKAVQLEKEFFLDLTLKEYAAELNNEVFTDNEGKEHLCNKYNINTYNITIATNWIFKIEKVSFNGEPCLGSCCGDTMTISIDPAHTADDTLIHEMIHAYEYMLTERCKQYITMRLFQKLSLLINDLWDRINTEAFGLFRHNHTLLFMLKSWDLDLQHKPYRYPLGTIAGTCVIGYDIYNN